MQEKINSELAIDRLIKTKFKLYRGFRPKAQDDAIYETIFDLCFEEIVRCIDNMLPEKDRTALTLRLAALTASGKDDKQKMSEAIVAALTYLQHIPGYHAKLLGHVDTYLDTLVYKSAKLARERKS